MQMFALMLAGSGTAAAGAAGAGVAAGAGAAAAGGFSLMKVISAGASIASGLASIAQGRSQAASLESAAEFEAFNGRQELLRGRAEALDAVKAANDAVAAAQVAGFAAGLQGTGSVTSAKNNALEDAEFQVGMSRTNAAINAGARRGNAARMRSDAGAARLGGIFGAVGEWGNAFSRFQRTG